MSGDRPIWNRQINRRSVLTLASGVALLPVATACGAIPGLVEPTPAPSRPSIDLGKPIEIVIPNASNAKPPEAAPAKATISPDNRAAKPTVSLPTPTRSGPTATPLPTATAAPTPTRAPKAASKILPAQFNPFGRQFNEDTLTVLSPKELRELQVIDLPVGFQLVEEYQGHRLVRSAKKDFSSKDLTMLKFAIDRMPQKLAEVPPAAIVITESSELKGAFAGIIEQASASGPYIYTYGKSYSLGSDYNFDDFVELVFHETVHTYQFMEGLALIDPKKMDEYSRKRWNWEQFFYQSKLAADFAQAAGWTRIVAADGRVNFKLDNTKDAQTRKEARTNLSEDMAYTLASVAWDNNLALFSPSRIDWALKYLGTTRTQVEQGHLPELEMWEEIRSFSVIPLYDFNRWQQIEKGALIASRQTFAADYRSLGQVVEALVPQLERRGWQGSFDEEKISEDKLHSRVGRFKTPLREATIEIRNFDEYTRGKFDKPGTFTTVMTRFNI